MLALGIGTNITRIENGIVRAIHMLLLVWLGMLQAVFPKGATDFRIIRAPLFIRYKVWAFINFWCKATFTYHSPSPDSLCDHMFAQCKCIYGNIKKQVSGIPVPPFYIKDYIII